MLDLRAIHEGLEELSSQRLQEKLWLRGDGEKIGSFEEAVCYVFDDGGITRAMDNGYLAENFSDELNFHFLCIDKLVGKFPTGLSPQVYINHALMKELRTLSRKTLVMFDRESGFQADDANHYE